MGKLRELAGFLAIPAIVIVLMIVIVLHEPKEENAGITRAAAARAVVLAVNSPEEFQQWVNDGWASHFSFSAEEAWYVPYLDYMYAMEYLDMEETPADREHADGYLTCKEAVRIAQTAGKGLEKKLGSAAKDGSKPVLPEHWWNFYEALVKKIGAEQGVHEEMLALYGTADNIPGAMPWTAYTDQGQKIFTGLALDAYIDRRITVLVREDEIICVKEKDDNVCYENVWVIDGNDGQLHINVADLERKIPFRGSARQAERLAGTIADLEIFDGEIIKVSVKKDRIRGKLLAITENALEIEHYGKVPVADSCRYLKVYGDFQTMNPQQVMVGSKNFEYVTAKGRICAVLAVRSESEDQIRVLITGQGFKDIYHERIMLESDADMTLTQGENSTCVEGETLELLPGDERLKKGRLIICPAENHEITVTSLERTDGCPSYGGRLEVLEEDGKLILINEVLMEDYLKKVVPSEMSGTYELEALKAQAICTRTYAYTQMRSNRYSQYGAQLDDSTNFQVYNNANQEARTNQAVAETYGKILKYQGQPFPAYYFSTSCGNTTDGTVWDMDPQDTPYLKSVVLRTSRQTCDWSDNAEFTAWIKKQDVKAFDSDSPYFRWKVTTNAKILAKTFDSVGEIREVKITRRGGGGVALEMLIRGSEGEITVSGQNSIRAALGDGSLTLTKKDGSTSGGWNSLPSGFLSVERDGREEDGTQKFTVYGGGYGHGAGMSQNGAQGMAKAGMKYDEILKFFYEGITIEDWK